jgi:hypothetical protein
VARTLRVGCEMKLWVFQKGLGCKYYNPGNACRYFQFSHERNFFTKVLYSMKDEIMTVQYLQCLIVMKAYTGLPLYKKRPLDSVGAVWVLVVVRNMTKRKAERKRKLSDKGNKLVSVQN